MPNNSFGTQLLQGAAGGALGIGLGAISNQLQYGMQKKLMKQQLHYNMDMADYNYTKQLDMWNATNYGAQVEHLKKAGLNPGLLYGMGGGGGATVGHQGGQVAAPQATNHAASATQAAGMAMQLGLLKAQKENIEADTANKQADTANKPIQGENIKASTQGLILSNQYNAATLEDRIDMIDTEAATAIKKLDREAIALQLDRTTVIQRAEIIKQQAIGEALKNILTQAQTKNVKQDTALKGEQINKLQSDIKVNEQTIKNMAQEIMIKWDELSLKSRRQMMEEMIAAEYGEIMPRDLINVLSEAVDGILRVRTIPGKK